MPRGVYNRKNSKPRTQAHAQKRGQALAQRLNRETILEHMPKIYFVEDLGFGRYRVGRTDWPGDCFNLVPRAEFDIFRRVYDGLNMPLLDKTHDDED